MIVGLTGGIGSGKSTVAQFFELNQIPIVDADAVSHQLTQAHHPTLQLITQALGAEAIAPDGSLNRPWVRALIFEKPQYKQILESILHPQILAQCQQQLAVTKTAPYQILMVPLLFENPNFKAACDLSISVQCDTETRIARVMQRSHLSREGVVAILNNQLTDEERSQQADYLIYNNGSLAQLKQQVEQIDLKLRSFNG